MANLLNTLIETIQKDIETLNNVEKDKHFRKESSLILSRIESAKKLVSSDNSLSTKLECLEQLLMSLKK